MSNHTLPARAGALAVVFACVSLFTAAQAQTPAAKDDDLLTILITASRFAETADETLAPVTVITREEIEERQIASVEEALRQVPGITFGGNGGRGQTHSLFMRGTESNHVLVLIDGVKVGSVSLGVTQFSHLPIDQIEKIEVVRGPRSSLYGSEAIGGVVQIFTRQSGRDGRTRPWISVGGGSHNTGQLAAGLSGGGDSAWYNFDVSTLETGGYDACRASFCIAERDHDGYDNTSFAARVGAMAGESLRLEAHVLRSENDTEFDGYRNQSEHAAGSGGVKATWSAGPKWRSSVQFGRAKDDLKTSLNGRSRHNRFTTERDQINWQNDFQLSAQTRVTAGVDYTDEQLSGSTDYTVDERDNTGVFALLRSAVGGNDWELALRRDDDEQFGGVTTGSLGWGRDLGGGRRVTASYGTAFKAPTFGELYNPPSSFGGNNYGGNPDLEPEESRSFDVGFSRAFRNGRLAVNAYRTAIDNLINTRNIGADRRSMNIEETEIHGLEFTASTRLSDWDIKAAVTALDTEQTKGVNRGKQLLRRPREKLDLDLSRRLGNHSFGVNIYAQGKSEDVDGVDLAGFATLNLRGELRLNNEMTLALKIDNVLDKEYETVADYPQPRASAFATLRWTPSP